MMASCHQHGSGNQEGLAEHTDMVQHCKKKRASYVCRGCRKRKVKCDLVITGTPCSNCHEDGIACIALESKRSRRYRQQNRRVSSAPSRSPAYLSTQATDVPLPLEESNTCPDDCLSPSHRLSSRVGPFVELPAYVRAVHTSFKSDETGFLASRGALTIPEGGVRDELIAAFVLYVHPYMPVLDLQEFFDSIHQTHNSSPVSLLLLQAILFAGCAFVDMSLLEMLGYRTRRDARKAFYIKVKYLYELEWEPDPIPVIQALLLITYWFESPEDQKDPWYWLGVCRLLANRIGLGRNHESVRNPPKWQRLSHRLWWLCVLRDCVIAAATRKPLQFKEEDINMPLLTLEDFETQPIDTRFPPLRDSRTLKDAVIRQTLARLCIKKIKLALLVAQILTHNYTPSRICGSPMSSVILYSPSRPLKSLSTNIGIRRNLGEWCCSLPDDCVFPGPSTYAPQQDLDNKVLFLHRAVLRVFSLMAFGLFYRPLLAANGNPLYETHFPQRDVKRTVTNMAEEIASIAELFCERNMVQKLPPCTTTLFISALPTFIAQIKNRTEALRDNPRFQFRWCSEAIFQQRDIWPTADHAYSMIQAMVSRAQLPDPQGLLPGPDFSEDRGRRDTVIPSRGLVLPDSATSMLIPDRGMNVVDVLPGNMENGTAWLAFDAIFNQYCNYVESYQAE
ncbi:hypothetical protein RU639_012657 [Aspergillus parasiticus]|uniref:Fungal-specific transcription factor domain-containing protein n=1 Tax=Aspergillus transmontanensis TaxID=1034304 RepID=A0A5N6VRJ0_9EURO|nr:fungal-specific transcription factor domain-containing protein [Aspergillus transmontanensis]